MGGEKTECNFTSPNNVQKFHNTAHFGPIVPELFLKSQRIAFPHQSKHIRFYIMCQNFKSLPENFLLHKKSPPCSTISQRRCSGIFSEITYALTFWSFFLQFCRSARTHDVAIRFWLVPCTRESAFPPCWVLLWWRGSQHSVRTSFGKHQAQYSGSLSDRQCLCSGHWTNGREFRLPSLPPLALQIVGTLPVW